MEIDMNKEHWEQKKCPQYDCRKKQCECGLEKVFLSAALGDDSKDSPVAPKNGEYCNAIVVYEANGHVYIYSQEGIPTLVESEGSDVEEIIEQLEGRLDQEVLDRQAADNVLQGEIDDIKNSPDVVDIVATYAALQAYDTSKLGDNDIVRVLQDETHDGQSTYYRWNKQSSTWTYIGAVGDYYTKGQVDTLLADKQDELTAGANISIAQVDNDLVISATDTTYTAGTNVSISSGNVISATDTTYSDFAGTDGNTDGAAGLVPAPLTTDAGKFLKADGTWDTAGGGGPTVVQTTGTSQTDVMSQNAVSSMVFADPGTDTKIKIGSGASVSAHSYNMAIGASSSANGTQSTAVGYTAKARPNGTAFGYNAQAGTSSSHNGSTAIGQSAYGGDEYCTAIGSNANTINSYSTAVGSSARARSERSVAIGASATVENSPAMAYSVALGANSKTTRAGEVNIGTGDPAISTDGFNSSAYRVIGGVYDGQDAHDAATVGQLNGRVLQNAGAPTTSTVGTVGQLLEDTTNGKLYQCTAIDTTDPNNPSYTWTEIGAGGGGGGDTVYSTVTTSNDSAGGAVYIGNLDATQTEQPDPTTTDNHYKYYWALPQNNTTKPKNYSINIGGSESATYAVVIGFGAYDSSNASAGGNVIIGNSAHASTTARWGGVVIGQNANIDKQYCTAIGASSACNYTHSVALGDNSQNTRDGEVYIGPGGVMGFNNSPYRVLGGVHDPVDAHDAATKGYVDARAGGPVTLLTSADYNWDSSGQGGDPDAIAGWLLNDGWYITDDTTSVYMNSDNGDITTFNALLRINGGGQEILEVAYGLRYCEVNPADGTIIGGYTYPDGTIGVAEINIQDMMDLVVRAPIASDETPTSATEGTLGQLWTDTTNMHTYQCTAIDDTDPDNIEYTWTQRW